MKQNSPRRLFLKDKSLLTDSFQIKNMIQFVVAGSFDDHVPDLTFGKIEADKDVLPCSVLSFSDQLDPADRLVLACIFG